MLGLKKVLNISLLSDIVLCNAMKINKINNIFIENNFAKGL